MDLWGSCSLAYIVTFIQCRSFIKKYLKRNKKHCESILRVAFCSRVFRQAWKVSRYGRTAHLHPLLCGCHQEDCRPYDAQACRIQHPGEGVWTMYQEMPLRANGAYHAYQWCQPDAWDSRIATLYSAFVFVVFFLMVLPRTCSFHHFDIFLCYILRGILWIELTSF